MEIKPVQELINLWANSLITNEQMIGQLLLHVIELQKQVQKLNRSQSNVVSK